MNEKETKALIDLALILALMIFTFHILSFSNLLAGTTLLIGIIIIHKLEQYNIHDKLINQIT